MTEGAPRKRRGRKEAEPTRPPEQFLELAELLDYVGQVIARGVPGGVWVRAEIASVTDRRHLYLDLVQLGEEGEVAKCRATVWARERFALESKFRRATGGGGLTAGLKVLLFGTAEFHPQYGFSFNILDLAPEYTVGDAALRLESMRAALLAEGVYGLNRALPEPADYARVAVIAPREAAGLGDFRREADPLAAAGLVEFHYFEATFQGREAAASLRRAVEEARALHAEAPLDALFVIRGGGAVTDLAWLNDLDFARALATFPVPVVTGLGHARDDTLPDEVACVRTDTPSKAAARLVGTVVGAAAQVQEAVRTVRTQAARVLVDAEAGTEWTFDRLRSAAGRTVERAASEVDGLMRQALGLTPQRTLARGYALVRSEAGVPVTRAAAVAQGDTLSLQFADGELDVRALN
ncbi:Exodeoxyribonuclease VII large subunit [Deinococcus reticulitermitis]|uniref:Exodeoxyribonuclease 7 large subunit n=1 Tax=Deinococcus reticulitermitis TaxID=856736 RepID=A0A1H7A007_9DEIO|nr:exodeoxyribonuclease VII large subunit [Deinococcus reticulitermitis]SEJ58931.1 Exodeoxyribonuclease VII large subunit [Deinococcus reticulitermitis]